MLGFKDFNCARVILSGIEVMHMIKKGQMKRAKKRPFLPPTSSTLSLHKQYVPIVFVQPSCLTATEPEMQLSLLVYLRPRQSEDQPHAPASRSLLYPRQRLYVS